MKKLAFLALLFAALAHADDHYIAQPVVITNPTISGTLQVQKDFYISGEDMTLHCTNEPVVKKEGDGWVITFKPKAEGK